MKNFKIIIGLISLLVLNGCIKDKITTQKAYLHNNTSHNIKILYYKSGTVLPGDTIKMNAEETILFAESWDYGDYKAPGFTSGYAGGPDDSAIVIFNDSFRVVHYFNTPILLSEKYYLNESLRNISNPLSYEFEMVRNKNERINYHRYYFTEADYEYAKD